MKTCFKCGAEKPLLDFYKHEKMKDGYLNKCKDCTRSDVNLNRLKNIDHYKEYEKNRAALPRRVEARANYAKTEAGKAARKRAKSAYIERNPIKRGVHVLTGNAIRDGLLIKKPCEICGNEKVHAHHDDYAKPLNVRWLCPAHHAEWHKENGEGLNA